MNLYFSPLACSLATRIALYEAGAQARFTQVDTRSKRVSDGSDFLAVAPMGQVPALRTDDGIDAHREHGRAAVRGGAISGGAARAGVGSMRARLQQWLGFIGTEIHKAIFIPLLDPRANDAVKAYARDKIALRMDVLQQHLADNAFLLPQFSVADAYLVTVLNWAAFTGVDLAQWPAVRDYFARVQKRDRTWRGHSATSSRCTAMRRQRHKRRRSDELADPLQWRSRGGYRGGDPPLQRRVPVARSVAARRSDCARLRAREFDAGAGWVAPRRPRRVPGAVEGHRHDARHAFRPRRRGGQRRARDDSMALPLGRRSTRVRCAA